MARTRMERQVRCLFIALNLIQNGPIRTIHRDYRLSVAGSALEPIATNPIKYVKVTMVTLYAETYYLLTFALDFGCVND